MLDLAVAVDHNRKMVTIAETNRGKSLAAPAWPQDSDFQLVAFDPNGNVCDVVTAGELAADISKLIRVAKSRRVLLGRKPAWLKRLEQYSAGAEVSE